MGRASNGTGKAPKKIGGTKIVEGEIVKAEDGNADTIDEQLMAVHLLAGHNSEYEPELRPYIVPPHEAIWKVPAHLLREYQTALNELKRRQENILTYLTTTGQPIPYPFNGCDIIDPVAQQEADLWVADIVLPIIGKGESSHETYDRMTGAVTENVPQE